MFGSVSGLVLLEGAGLGGITVSINAQGADPVVTGADGGFQFPNVLVGDYTVTISGWDAEVAFEAAAVPVTVTEDQNSNLTFNSTIIRTAQITGTVILDEAGEPNREVNLSGPEGDESTLTDANGNYEFTGLRRGTYTVSLGGVDENFRFESTTAQVTLEIGQAQSRSFEGIREIFATGRITAIEDQVTEERLSFSNLKGAVDVYVRIDEGTRELEEIEIVLGGMVVGTLDTTDGLPARSTAAGAGAAEVLYRIPVETAPFDPITGAPLLVNGSTQLIINITTVWDGKFELLREEVVIQNSDRIGAILFETDPADGVEGEGGHTWFGNQDLQFRVVPVVYDPDLVIGAIEVEAFSDASANGSAGLDFGSGPGMAHTILAADSPDFSFTATLADNAGVEDDPNGEGQYIIVRRVFDADMNNISSSFDRSVRSEAQYFDFLGPTLGPAAGFLVDGEPFQADRFYSSGTITRRDIEETGVGGLVWSAEVRDGVGGVTEDVTEISQVPEGARNYTLVMTRLEDALGNTTDVAPVAQPGPFGVDKTALTLDNVKPVAAPDGEDPLLINPRDDVGDGDSDNKISLSIGEPNLGDGTPGAGFGSLTFIGNASGETTELDLSSVVLPRALGSNTLDLRAALPDGSYTFTFTGTDNAIPGNTTTEVVQFRIDDTDPVINVTTMPPQRIETGTNSIGFSLGLNASDENGLSQARVRVLDGAAAGLTSCEDTDPLLSVGTGAGQINIGTVDFLEEADDWSEVFQVQRPVGGGQVFACFLIDVRDPAVDVNGNNEPNIATRLIQVILDFI